MATPSELHNIVANSAVRQIVETMHTNNQDYAATMVVLESVMLGILLANEKIHGITRETSVEMLESAVQAVFTRLGGLRS